MEIIQVKSIHPQMGNERDGSLKYANTVTTQHHKESPASAAKMVTSNQQCALRGKEKSKGQDLESLVS